MNVVESTLRGNLPPLKTNSSGWLTMNCPMCIHNGESRPDSKGRGGWRFDNDKTAYHCFNCGYTTGWRPGSKLGFKLIKLMRVLGIDEAEIQRLKILLWDQVIEEVAEEEQEVFNKEWPEIPYPFELTDLRDEAVEYLTGRGIFELAKWKQTDQIGMKQRIILPYTDNSKVVGYMARWIGNPPKGTAKMLRKSPDEYVFNLDKQPKKRKYTIVCEGEYDALAIGGVAILSNKISKYQAQLIEDLDTEPVMLADKDPGGKSLVEDAINLGWNVSFPDWPAGIKDANEAILHFGRVATLQSILMAIEHSPLKVKLLMRRWCA
ncbi:hypothetical protein N9V27_00255 [bacterium]|nr:hypothetical protein [bacterium]